MRPTLVGVLVFASLVVGFTAGFYAQPLVEPPPSEEEDVSPPGVVLEAFRATFPTRIHEVGRAAGYSPEGETTLLRFALALSNMTRVTAVFEFVDANRSAAGAPTRPDLFEIEIKAPHGDVSGATLARSDPQTGGSRVSVTYQIRTPPEARDYRERTREDAQARASAAQAPDFTLAAEGLVRVTLLEAGDSEAQGVAVPGAGPAADEGNDWTLTLRAESYALAMSPSAG